LFGNSLQNDFVLDDFLLEQDENATNEDNLILTRIFEEEETREAVFQMDKNKAAGPDGIPAEFYQIVGI
jgi:hypothetical protein